MTEEEIARRVELYGQIAEGSIAATRSLTSRIKERGGEVPTI